MITTIVQLLWAALLSDSIIVTRPFIISYLSRNAITHCVNKYNRCCTRADYFVYFEFLRRWSRLKEIVQHADNGNVSIRPHVLAVEERSIRTRKFLEKNKIDKRFRSDSFYEPRLSTIQ